MQSTLVRSVLSHNNYDRLLTKTGADGGLGTRVSDSCSTFHSHPSIVGPRALAVPYVSSFTCHRHASQSATRGEVCVYVGTNAKRSVHHRGWSRGISTGASGVSGRPFSAVLGAVLDACTLRMMGSGMANGKMVVGSNCGGAGVPGTRSTVRVGAKSRARFRNAFGASGVVGSR